MAFVTRTLWRLVYILKNIADSNIFQRFFYKVISHYKNFSYKMNVFQKAACSVVKLIMIGNFALLFYCTLVDVTSESMSFLTQIPFYR